jgi:hypothetical protein
VKQERSNKPPAFEIDGRVHLDIEKELAISLGALILETDTKNTALLALGHQLKNLEVNNGPREPEPTE